MPIKLWRAVVAFGLSMTAALAFTFTPAAAASTSIWSGSVTPQGVDSDPGAVEVGVRFHSDTSGYITGVRFYKFASNTGTHVGNLWTNGGVLLASATFTAETASGWQQVIFATPVAVTANTTYVASYHTNAGHYAVNSGYFASAGVDNAPLHALQDGVGGANGVYRYGATSSFPNQTWQATNYWVDVVFSTTVGGGGDTTPPTVNSVWPLAGATDVSVTSVITATFSEMMSFASVNPTTFELRDPAGNLVPASAWAGGETPTSTLTPTSPLMSGTTYTATAKGGPNGVKDASGNAMLADFSWSLTTAGTPPSTTCPCTLWNGATAVGGMDGDSDSVEVGLRFRSDVSGYITGVRFYKHGSNTGTHIGNLWTNGGTRIATATFIGETASGWQQVTFASPVPIAANTTYVASYHTDAGHYAATSGYFNTGFDSAPLHALRDGVDGPSGVYRYGPTLFPNQTYQSANYWVDVVFATTIAPTPPTVTSVTPAAGSTGVSPATIVTATISGSVSYSSVNTTTFELRDSAGNLVPASVGGGGESQTFILSPASALAYNTTYTATVKGGATGIKDMAGNPMAADYTWSFTTGAAPSPPGTCPCTIWNAASTTAAGPDADSGAVEVGMRFRSDEYGWITGLRFYKFSTNTGTHVANLWRDNGTLLASATYVNESASGWQQVMFATPIAITANTTYVASYHTNAGHYAANSGYFVASFDNPPLHAVQDGVYGPTGLYRYGVTSAFPTNSYLSANYWVDVVFVTSVNPGDITPPTVVSTSPPAGAAAIATNAYVTATFSELLDPPTISGSTVELRDGSGALVPATVQYAIPTGSAILIPTLGLVNGTTYTATIKGGSVDPRAKDLAGNPLAANYSWTFTTVAVAPPPAQTCPCSLWSSPLTGIVADSDPDAVEVGIRFQSETPGYITGLRFYKAPENTGVHVGSLWTNAGVLLARATFSESPSGWQQVNLPVPLAISANTTYVTSYHTDVGRYVATNGYFAAPYDNPPLHALRDGVDGPNGVYMYSATPTFPSQTYQSGNYWVDVIFTTTPPDLLRPTIVSVTPASGSTGVAISSNITATFSEPMNPATFNEWTFELLDPATGVAISAYITYDVATRTATLDPSFPLKYSTTYTAKVRGGFVDPMAKDLAGNSLAVNNTWLITTAAAP